MKIKFDISRDSFTLLPTIGIVWDNQGFTILAVWLSYGIGVIIDRKRKGSK